MPVPVLLPSAVNALPNGRRNRWMKAEQSYEK